MTFDIKTAAKILPHYEYLIGKDFDGDDTRLNITHIVIAPDYDERFSPFLNYFVQTLDYKKALSLSGFNENKVLVLAISYSRWNNTIFHYELDKFLSSRNIEKVYLNPDFLKD